MFQDDDDEIEKITEKENENLYNIEGAKQKQELKIVERLEKLKKQVLNKEIGVERGQDILYSINNLN